MDVYRVEGPQLRELITALTASPAQAHSLSVGVDGESITFKIDAAVWSPPMGTRQP